MEHFGLIPVATFFGGMFPGPLGLVAFVAVKFGGYVLAGLVLRRFYPGIEASATRIAVVRTGIGLFIGLCFLGLTLTALNASPAFVGSPMISYSWLVGLRLAVWSAVIGFFTSKVDVGDIRKFILFVILGAAWSCLLDVPGIALAIVTPGRIPVC